MIKYSNFKLWQKILLGILSLIIISLTAVFITVYIHLSSNIEHSTKEKLIAIKNLKKEQVETYFSNLETQTELMGTYKNLVETFKASNAAYNILKSSTKSNDYLALKEIRDSIWHAKYNITSRISFKKKSDTMLPNNVESFVLQVYSWLPDKVENLDGLQTYRQIDADFGSKLKLYAKKVGFYDFLFVESKTGNIVYSINKESDFGASIYDSCFRYSGIKKAFEHVRNSNIPKSYIQDFEAYAPSYYNQACFISAPILENGKNIGVLIAQVDISHLNRICTFSENWSAQGMGSSGEVYLVGKDSLMRSQSRFIFTNKKTLLQDLKALKYSTEEINYIKNYNNTINTIKVKSQFVNYIHRGLDSVSEGKDYRGKEAIAAYSPLKINHLDWGIVAKIDAQEAYIEVYSLRNFLTILFIIILLTGIVSSIVFSKRITHPILTLNKEAKAISEGDFGQALELNRNDEIGELAQSFQTMKSKIVGLIQDLTVTNNDLEIKRKDLLDSITYAQKIQENIFPTKELVNKYIPNSFLFFQPRDIVSGDFYWAIEHENELFLAVCDSTGHGIPGAFMSMLNVSFLNEAVLYEQLKDPADIINRVRNLLEEVFKSERHDGMDGILIRYNPKSKVLEYAAANNPIVHVRNGEYTVLDYDKMPIGNSPKKALFRKFEVEIEPGDCIYLITDGFADQFGGDSNKKYKYKPLFEFFLQHASLPAESQRIALIEEFELWQRDNEQVDDVTILGIKF